MTCRTRCPCGPMHDPLPLTSAVERTAILLRCPASRDGHDLDGSVRDLGHLECESARTSSYRGNVTIDLEARRTPVTSALMRAPCSGLPGLVPRWKVAHLPRSTRIIRGLVDCWMTPETRSPSLPLNSVMVASPSASRSRDKSTRRAVAAAMRPALRGVVEFSDHLTLVVDLGPHGHVAGLAVELDASVLGRAVRALVGNQQRLFDGLTTRSSEVFPGPGFLGAVTRYPSGVLLAIELDFHHGFGHIVIRTVASHPDTATVADRSSLETTRP